MATVAGEFFALSFFILLSNRRGPGGRLSAALSLLAFAGLCMSGSRGALAGLLAGLLWTGLRWPGFRRIALGGIATSLALLIAGILFFPGFRTRFAAPFDHRLEQWRLAGWLSAGHRMLGIGPGAVERIAEGRPPEVPAYAKELRPEVRLPGGRTIRVTVRHILRNGRIRLRLETDGHPIPFQGKRVDAFMSGRPLWAMALDVDGDGAQELLVARAISRQDSTGDVRNITGRGTRRSSVLSVFALEPGPALAARPVDHARLITHLHNLPLQLAVETGLPGLLTWLAIPAYFLLRWRRTGGDGPALVPEAALIAFLVLSLADVPLFRGINILLGIAIGMREPARETNAAGREGLELRV
ncbi:MAG: hypothetical protein AAB215_04405 [Planctomycetota bacterium]